MLHRFGNAEDLHVSTKCSVELTDENFKSVIESNSGCSKSRIYVKRWYLYFSTQQHVQRVVVLLQSGRTHLVR